MTDLADRPAAAPEAMDALYRGYAEPLRALCRRRLGDGPDAEDACQEALLRAWSALPRFDPAREMWPWLATIAGNVCIDVQRRQRTARVRPLRAELPAAGPDELALADANRPVVQQALGQIPPASRRVIVLRDVEGWSYEEIGRHEDRTVAAIRTAVHRARHQLRVQVEAVARARGGWPLPTVLGVVWARTRRAVARRRASMPRAVPTSTLGELASTGAVDALGTVAVRAALGLAMATTLLLPSGSSTSVAAASPAPTATVAAPSARAVAPEGIAEPTPLPVAVRAPDELGPPPVALPVPADAPALATPAPALGPADLVPPPPACAPSELAGCAPVCAVALPVAIEACPS